VAIVTFIFSLPKSLHFKEKLKKKPNSLFFGEVSKG
jgi:hypothetical protein